MKCKHEWGLAEYIDCQVILFCKHCAKIIVQEIFDKEGEYLRLSSQSTEDKK